MVKKLRKKFVIVAVCSVAAVLLVIMSAINIVNYIKINEDANKKLEIISENDGDFRLPEKPKEPFVKDRRDNIFKDESHFSPEAPFETRYFSVKFSSDETVIETETTFIAAVTQDEAESLAMRALKKGKTSGFIGDYKYSLSESGDDKLVVMLDCSRDMSNFRYFLFTSMLVAITGVAAVFILLLVFSKSAVRPIVESYEKQKQFITDASHEIKTPLTIIDANTEVLEMENGENEWTKSIKNQVKRLSKLTSNLISLSRMDEAGYSLPMSAMSLSYVVAETVEPFLSLAEVSEKNLTIDIEEGINIKGNSGSVAELISILVDNALTYTNKNGRIAVSLKKTGKHAVLAVYNTADNLEKASLDMLFERFYRSDNSRNSQTGGYGIGLSSAKAIVDTHSGKISAKSDDGKSLTIEAVFKVVAG